MATDTTEFRLRFGGNETDINAATYGVILVNTVTLIEEANKELRTGAHLEIRVKSQRQGSFLVDLGIEPIATIQAVAPLITPENIRLVKSAATAVIETVTNALGLKKAMTGEKPKQVEEKADTMVIVTGDKNTVTITKPVYNLAGGKSTFTSGDGNSFQGTKRRQSRNGFFSSGRARRNFVFGETLRLSSVIKEHRGRTAGKTKSY